MLHVLDVTKLPPGTMILDKYRVVKTLGVGGMGAVVAAEDLALDRRVALKILLPEMVRKPGVVQRFMLEAKAATRVKSPHVAKVIDVGHLTGPGYPEEGLPYMVMEYLEGRDLSDWVRMGKKLRVPEAIDLITQACEGLAAAHREGVVHRDIKPANLFVTDTAEGRVVKVLDFGISKILDEDPNEMSLTQTSAVLGSGLYMSPEQMRSARQVDQRTDVYSLGVCIYELLTGTQPHTAETFSELCVKVNVDPPTPLRDYRPDISDDLARTIAR
ncbi:MAG: serine/threonine protein kinase, partial [Myxococcales bacterium]|nr:serine/threonine protein kinase [Myxococcales bacterium]